MRPSWRKGLHLPQRQRLREILLPFIRSTARDVPDAGRGIRLHPLYADGGSGGVPGRPGPIGIRPLYYGYDAKGVIVFASEEPRTWFGPGRGDTPAPRRGHYQFQGGRSTATGDIAKVDVISHFSLGGRLRPHPGES